MYRDTLPFLVFTVNRLSAQVHVFLDLGYFKSVGYLEHTLKYLLIMGNINNTTYRCLISLLISQGVINEQ